MPPKFTDEEHEQLRQLIHVADDVDEGHEHEARQRRHPKFDGTINLGHVLTIITMVIGLATVYVNGRVTTADHESRLRALEEVSRDFKLTLAKVAENEAQAVRTQERIATTLDWLVKEKKQ